MISWKAREASACEAHAARRYNLSSLRPQEQATYQSCAMLGLPRGAHSIWCIGSQTTQGGSSLWSPGGGSIHGGAWTPDA